ncbi:hypothetical protein A3B87_02505 [Candidatus Kuenenbacteria bacterium RIFCSPHIGHO2_02_FULL_39_13]|uniref:PIN domain-containing protein n=1 Tax=Candidatus Kuenenbacteria bacterium RIFCSPHIGHO2_02_FULL_39_13 TaxID=1798561 RepID=A0A1F6FLF7_9BACT|nr:MAG: hypothetical protein A3B87_02505 [Candidatus Kuenenbacteria bacterium RIFCSPHIGHO2_02_FULL_39_13]
MQYALDTNSILYYLRSQKNLSSYFAAIVEGLEFISLSVITKIELFSYPGLELEEDRKIKEFIEDFKINELDDEIVDKTIEIRKKYKLKLPDAVIAATALANNLILITHNKKDFDKVMGLQIIDPLD